MLHDASSIFTNGLGFGRAPGFIILLSKELSFREGNIFFLILLFSASNGKGTLNCTFPSILGYTVLFKAVLQAFDKRHKGEHKSIETAQAIQREVQKELSNLCKYSVEQKLHLIIFLTFFGHDCFLKFSSKQTTFTSGCHSQLIPNCTRNGWIHSMQSRERTKSTELV